MAQCTFTHETLRFPAWAAEELKPDCLISGGRLTAAAFPSLDQVTVKLSANANVDATSLSVDAIAMQNPVSSKTGVVIPSGTNLYFGEAKELARVTADVSIGAASITVEALPTALEDDDEAIYSGMNVRKPVASGILVGRTFNERAAGTGFGVADVGTPDDELFLVAFTVEDAAINPDVVLLRHNTKIYEDLLPGWAGLSATAQAAIRSRYHCLLSAG
ncbi:MAG: hypothetical protein ACFB0G_11115 [Leptolyngbyaceae cyanobacterium]